MNIRSTIGTVYRVGKRIYRGYYLKNMVECKRNKELLENARNNLKGGFNDNNPLVSVLIPTYNRANLLTERSVQSVLRQTHQNFEIIIVGDHCTDNTEELLKNFNDERIKFYNLPKRGDYPTDPHSRWMVAGTTPANKAIELASGQWMAPLDDDDEFSEDHIEVLLNYALKYNYEMVYGIVQAERAPGKWINIGSYPPEGGKIGHCSVLYHSKLKFFTYDINAWKYGEPADWNMWRRMKDAGVRIGFIDKVVSKAYMERLQWGK